MADSVQAVHLAHGRALTVLEWIFTLLFTAEYIVRLLRVFRVFKLTAYIAEYQFLGRALAASGRKILVFLSAVLMLVLVMGTVMYVVEGQANGFTSIPTSVYWAITTVTTVGFGDITPRTDLGRLISSFLMLMGWGILAVPTGIVTAEMAAQRQMQVQHAPTTRSCHECLTEGHAPDSSFCFHCGARLPPYQQQAEVLESPEAAAPTGASRSS